MDSWGRTLRDNSIYSLFGVGFILLNAFVGGYLLNPAFRLENLRTLLSVMIGAQASILAIVVSVTLISTQLIATRYAPRMATLPFRTPLFKGIFLLFAISIILDVILLLGANMITTPIYSGVFILSVVLFFTILLFLYYFVRGMVSRSKRDKW